MLLNDSYGMVPGLSTSRETYENAFRWSHPNQGVFDNALISGAARDSGNSPTYELRPGLLLGKILSTGLYKQYSPTATDGSEVASAILLEGLRMQDFEGNNQDKMYAVLVGGPVKSSKVLNLDLMARQQMDKFFFDDSQTIGLMQGNHWYPWKRFQTKTANYSIVASDNFTLFDNTGASGTVVLTLPTLAAGYFFGLYAYAAQTFRFTSAAGGDVVGGGSLVNSSASVAAIGGAIYIYSNPAGTKWIVEQHGTQTITFS